MLYGHKDYGEGTKYACDYCGDTVESVKEVHGVFCCERCAEPVTPTSGDFPSTSSMGAPAWMDREDEAINMQQRMRRES